MVNGHMSRTCLKHHLKHIQNISKTYLKHVLMISKPCFDWPVRLNDQFELGSQRAQLVRLTDWVELGSLGRAWQSPASATSLIDLFEQSIVAVALVGVCDPSSNRSSIELTNRTGQLKTRFRNS